MNNVDFTAIGQRVKQRRKACHMTQEHLAEQLGVSVGYISQVERGATRANLELLSRLADCLDCEFSDLLTGVDRPSGQYLDRELAALTARMTPRQKALLLELGEVLLRYP